MNSELMPNSFPPQVCPSLDRPFLRRVERRINFISGVVIGAFSYWMGKAIVLAVISGHLAAAAGGHP